jgi:perosamine synthetase
MLNQNLIVDMPLSIRESMQVLSSNGERIVFVLEGGKLIGSLSDGDIRRALLQGQDIDSSVLPIINRNVTTLRDHSSPAEIHLAFKGGKNFVPVLSNDGTILRIQKMGDSNIIPLSEPNLTSLESNFLNGAFSSNWISSSGSFIGEFEELFSDYIGAEHAITVSNGTLGLVLALKALGISPGDQVLIPNLTFGATANAVIQVGAEPVFCEVSDNDFNIDVTLLASRVTQKTRAIIPVHLYGSPVNMDELMRFARQYDLFVIEDAAEAVGTYYNNQHVGTFGHAGVFSFFANKTITTGEGGMVVFQDKELKRQALKMRSHGFSPENRYWHEIWGTNFRLTNLQAAIGVGQMKRVDELVYAKKHNAEVYAEGLSELVGKDFEIIGPSVGQFSSYWLNVIKCKKPGVVEHLAEYLESKNIETRRVFHPLHSQPAFGMHQSLESFVNSWELYSNGICLPSSTKLKLEDIYRVCEEISVFFDSFKD